MKKRTSKKLELRKEKVSELSQGNMQEVKGGRTTSYLHCVLNTNKTCATNQEFCLQETEFQCFTAGDECDC